MWMCPECGRKFTRNLQSHSCLAYDPEDLFAGKNPEVRELYNLLIDRVKYFGEIDVHAAKWNITVRRLSTFLTIIIEKTHLTLVFISKDLIDEFPVYHNNPTGSNRYSNAVKIESPDEVDDQLIGWLRQAWEIAL
jgi:hypothetical protein